MLQCRCRINFQQAQAVPGFGNAIMNDFTPRAQQALALASNAKDAALPLVQANPFAPEPLKELYRATIRVGDALSAPKIARRG